MRNYYTVNDPLFGPRYTSRGERAMMRVRCFVRLLLREIDVSDTESTNARPISPASDIQPELLPCPFCGGEAWLDEERGSFTVFCTSGTHEAATGFESGKGARERVITAWNTRLTSTTPTLGDMVMVPREPTEAMLHAGQREADANWGDFEQEAGAIWRSMLSAAPASPIPTSANGAGVRECKTCRGRKTVTVLEGTCQPQHEAPCPACVGHTIATATAPLSPATPTDGAGERELPTDRYGMTVVGRMRDIAENGTMPLEHRKDLFALLDLASTALSPALDNTAVEGLTDEQYKRLGYKLAAPLSDWFIRNADRKNPSAFINTDPAYFGMECASFIAGIVRAAETEKAR